MARTSGGTPAASYPLTTPAAGAISNDVNLPSNATTTGYTTASLGVGTWLVTMNGTIVGPAANVGAIELQVAEGSATSTFSGQTAGVCELAVDSARSNFALTFLATVTVAGTLILQANNQTGSTAVLKAATVNESWAGASGWTATRVA